MIFGQEAPKYNAHGISVVPLGAHGKKRKAPFFNDWTKWKDKPIDSATLENWLARFANNNIGLVCGPQSQIVGVDLDTEDPKIAAAIEKLLPKSPWRRVGRKGFVQAYKFNPKCNNGKTFKIIDKNGAMLVECLQMGNQFVLPPSIHPDTEKPYTSNCNLYDVLDQLLPLPDDFEDQLRAAISLITPLENKKSFRVMNYVSAGSRDTAMTQFAGMQAYAIQRGEISVKTGINNMYSWVTNQVQQVAGDATDPDKGVKSMLQFLIKDIHSKGHILPTGWDEDMTEEELKGYGLIFTEDQQEWTHDQIYAYLKGEFEAPEGGSSRKYTAIELMLKKISVSPKLSIIEKKRLMKYISGNSPEKVPMGVFEARVRELQRGGIAGANHTEIAHEAIKEFEDKIGPLAFAEGFFMTWGGSHWKKVVEKDILRMIAVDFGAMDAARRESDHKGIMRTISTLVPQELSKTRVFGVNFANGFLTTDMRLVEHQPSFGMTYTLPFRYMPSQAGKCPRFLKMMEDFWGNEKDYAERLHALKEVISATIMGKGPAYQQAILLKGKGGTGKSQLLNIIETMIPEEAQIALPPTEWSEKFEFAGLAGKLLNVCGELPEKAYIDGAAFKSVVAGDKKTSRHIFGSPFSFFPVAAHWFSSNHFPKSRDTSFGFNRRWAIFTFNNHIYNEDKVESIGKSIAEEEIEEIVAWALEIYPEMSGRPTYKLPPSHFEALKDLELTNSSVRQFLVERVVVEEGATIGLDEAHLAYWSYATVAASSSAVSKQRFKTEMEDYCNEGREKGELNITFERGAQGKFVFHNMKVLKK